jgi:hypothetical protein
MRNINQKRNQIRNDIRKVEREGFFLKERMKMMENYQHSTNLDAILENIKRRNHLEDTFEELIRIVNGVNFYSDVFKMVGNGLIQILIECLKEKVCLKTALEVINYMLAKIKPKKHCIDLYQRFYDCGLMDYLVDNLKDSEVATESMCILLSYSEIHQEENFVDYC